MPTSRPSRRERERDRHREEILDAALRVLSSRGIDGLTIEAVAREAEFAVGSNLPSLCVEGRDGRVALRPPHAAALLGDRGARTASDPFEKRLEAWVAAALGHAKGEVPLLKLFFASSTGTPVPGTRLRDTRDRYFRAIDTLVASGQDEGVVERGDRFHLNVCLFGMLSGYMRAALWDDSPAVRQAPAMVRRAFLEGFGTRAETATPFTNAAPRPPLALRGTPSGRSVL